MMCASKWQDDNFTGFRIWGVEIWSFLLTLLMCLNTLLCYITACDCMIAWRVCVINVLNESFNIVYFCITSNKRRWV